MQEVSQASGISVEKGVELLDAKELVDQGWKEQPTGRVGSVGEGADRFLII
jgi:hypothetical protein